MIRRIRESRIAGLADGVGIVCFLLSAVCCLLTYNCGGGGVGFLRSDEAGLAWSWGLKYNGRERVNIYGGQV